MASAPAFLALDIVRRRVMFALELIDPVTGLVVSQNVRVTADGLGAPTRTPSGRFVWNDSDPPTARTVTVRIAATDGQFADASVDLPLVAHEDETPIADLLHRVTLVPTGLYRPQPGLLAVSGMLVDTPDPPRTAMPGVTVALQYRHALDGLTVSENAYKGQTDARGGFVVALTDLADPTVAPLVVKGAPVVWLRLTDPGGDTLYSPLIPVRTGRLMPIPQPLAWSELSASQPPPPS